MTAHIKVWLSCFRVIKRSHVDTRWLTYIQDQGAAPSRMACDEYVSGGLFTIFGTAVLRRADVWWGVVHKALHVQATQPGPRLDATLEPSVSCSSLGQVLQGLKQI